MKTNFDLNKTGKRLPYTVPDGFFNEMENNIWKEISKETTADVRRNISYMRILTRTVTTIAAIVALLVVFNIHRQNSHKDSISNIEIAFSKLSDEDQTYLIGTYQDDIFINE